MTENPHIKEQPKDVDKNTQKPKILVRGIQAIRTWLRNIWEGEENTRSSDPSYFDTPQTPRSPNYFETPGDRPHQQFPKHNTGLEDQSNPFGK